jgi:CDP-diacylglycerol pyrophosphatase
VARSDDGRERMAVVPAGTAPGGRPRRGRYRRTVVRWIVAAALVLPALAARQGGAAMPGDPASPSDALWKIVSGCLDAKHPSGASLCGCSAFTATCCGDPTMPDADVVWAESAAFVAIRDIKACGCPASFVHGLALPRTRITGVEDPKRPDAIWPFAWDVARRHIADEREIALAINPAGRRSQNQLHVHLQRLSPGARAALDALAPPPAGARLDAPPALVLALPDLEHVFTTAAKSVAAGKLGAHGILVARARGGGYLAVVTDGASPEVLTIDRCR